MSDLNAVVRSLMRDVGAALRPLGFSGSGDAWRLVTPEGVAVITKQGSVDSTRDTKLFYLNMAVVPKAWWEWNHRPGNGSRPIDRAGETDGIRVIEGRVRGADGERWAVTPDTDIESLRADLLAGVAQGADRLVELLTPGRYLDELLAEPDKQYGHWHALVVLLAERGPSPELDGAFVGLRAAGADRPQAAEYIEGLVELANTRSHQGVNE
jgi:hypothetical protein